MDPTANLERQLELAREMVERDMAHERVTDVGYELAEHVIALHEWIELGGFLPSKWSRAALAAGWPPRDALQGAALLRLIEQRGVPSTVHINKPDEWMMASYVLVAFPDGFECGIAPDGSVSS